MQAQARKQIQKQKPKKIHKKKTQNSEAMKNNRKMYVCVYNP